MEIVIITGMSGAGKTSAINICQDNDYYTIDNLPPRLIHNYLNTVDLEELGIDKFAFVIDIRVRNQLNDLVEVVEEFRQIGHQVKVIFLDADDDVLIRRFQEKRRPHSYKDMTLQSAIVKERKVLKNIRELSDHYIDTTDKNLSELKSSIVDVLELSKDPNIKVISFGFKHGILKEADYLFDVRFIKNPFYDPELRNQTGLDQGVIDVVMEHEATSELVDKIVDLIDFLVPYFQEAGKNNIVIGIGCTGGKHRSVVISELINDRFKEKYNSTIFHRDRNMW